MSDLDDLLAEARAGQPAPRRGGLAFLVIAGVAVLGAIGATAAVAVGSTVALSPEPAVSAPTPSAPAVSSPAPPPAIAAEAAPEPAPGGVAVIRGLTVYDETSDISLIPRPSADYHERWSITPAESEVWLTQAHLDAVCMAEHGFTAAFIPVWDLMESGDNPGIAAELVEHNDGKDPAWLVAMDGEPDPPLGADYDWTQAGCHGASVHATGMHNAN